MKNNVMNDAEYNKERNEDFSKYNEDEMYKFFKSIRYAKVVRSYPNSLEKDIYKHVASIIKKQYPKYCDEDDIVKTLSMYGNIYTAQITKGLGNGLYHINSATVLIYSFLNKLNDSVVHELIHKLGYLKYNEDFYKMPKIYIEAGTELITNTVLNKPLCREMLLGKMWTRSVGVQPRYLTETALVNQLNMACGNDSLERSILNGRNYIEPEIKNIMGEEKYSLLFAKLNDICRLEKAYWKSSRKEAKETEIYNRIYDFQEDILHEILEKRISQVKTREEAEQILNEVMQFSDYRLKVEGTNGKDESFEIFFEEHKKALEERFKTTFEIKDITTEWENRYPIIMLEKSELDKEEMEKNKIDDMAESKEDQNGSLLKRFLKFGRPKKTIQDNTKNRLKLPDNSCYLNNKSIKSVEIKYDMKKCDKDDPEK